MQTYKYTLAGIIDDYQASDLVDYCDANTVLRVTLSDMHPDDSFYIEVPAEFADRSLNELFEYVFPSKQDQQKARLRTLDVVENPNLPAMYMHLVELLESEKNGEVVLDWSVNFGPVHLDVSTMVQEHCSLTYEEDSEESYKTLHLVLDEYEIPFSDYEDLKALDDDKNEFLGLYMHFVIINHNIKAAPSSAIRGNIKAALDYCLNENLILLSEIDDSDISISVTNQGINKITELEEECQYYIDNYDIFASVYFEEGFIDFEGEEGIDLRIAAMRYDGLNPYRANMVINLFTGVYDDHAENWQKEIQSEKFFARYFGGAADRRLELSAEELEHIVLEGKKIIDAIEYNTSRLTDHGI